VTDPRGLNAAAPDRDELWLQQPRMTEWADPPPTSTPEPCELAIAMTSAPAAKILSDSYSAQLAGPRAFAQARLAFYEAR